MCMCVCFFVGESVSSLVWVLCVCIFDDRVCIVVYTQATLNICNHIGVAMCMSRRKHVCVSESVMFSIYISLCLC